MPLRDAVASTTRHASKVIGRPRSVTTDVLFLKRPSGLDGVQIRRVRRLIKNAYAVLATNRSDARVVMGPEVVHHDHIPTPELGKQLATQPINESVSVGRREHRAQHHPSAETNRAQQREILAPVHGNAVDVLLAAFHPRVTAAHRQIQARLVQEHELSDRNAPDLLQKRGAFFGDFGT